MRLCLSVIISLLPVILESVSEATPSEDAVNNALKAAYEQSGMKSEIDAYGKCLEKKYVKKEQEGFWAALLFIADSISHNEIRVKWTF